MQLCNSTTSTAVRRGFHNLLILYGVTFVSLSVWRHWMLTVFATAAQTSRPQHDILTVASCRCAVTLIATDALPKIHTTRRQCGHILCDKRDCHFNFSCCQGNGARCASPSLYLSLLISFSLVSSVPLSSHIRLNNMLCRGRPLCIIIHGYA